MICDVNQVVIRILRLNQLQQFVCTKDKSKISTSTYTPFLFSRTLPLKYDLVSNPINYIVQGRSSILEKLRILSALELEISEIYTNRFMLF